MLKASFDNVLLNNSIFAKSWGYTEMYDGPNGSLFHFSDNSQFWILNSEFWILNSEFWIPNPEFWIPNSEFWILNKLDRAIIYYIIHLQTSDGVSTPYHPPPPPQRIVLKGLTLHPDIWTIF